MSKTKIILTIVLGVMLSTALIQTTFAQDIDVLVTPDEAEIEAGGSIQFDVFAFTVTGNRTPVNIDNISWSLSSDSLGTITEDGFFIAGKHVGKAEVKVTVVIGNRKFERVVVVIIGPLPRPFFRVQVVPAVAVVPMGTEKQFKVVILTPSGKKVHPQQIRWEVKPEDLGTISDDGLFVAGDEVGQGKVKAFVEIDGLTLHAAAKVIVSPPATGAITGNVINDNGSAPLEGAKVKAIRLGKIHWVQKAVTNAEGKYLVGDLIPGDYVLYANAKGFIGEFYDDTRNYLEATVLRIAEEDTLTDKDFGLSEGGKITGTVVTDDSNLPIAKAHVVAFLRLKPRFARHVLTADDGSYIIEALPKGTYVAKANAAGYKGEYYDNVEQLSEAALLNVEEGKTIDGINFGLATASAIRGVVTNVVDGSRIAGARIRAFLAPIIAFHPRIFKETRTNENGEYILQIRPGFYYVLASAEGFNSEFYDDARNIKDATLVQVFPDSHTVDIDFGLMPRGSISGIVSKQGTDIPIEGAVVEAFRENSIVDVASTLAGYRAKTDASGKYTIEDVPSGNYLVRAVAEGYLPEFYPEKPTKEGATLVEVKDGTDVENIDFTLEPGGSISGLVASEKDSLPIARALVQVWGANLRLHRRTYTQNDGNYKIGGLPTGKYLVQVIAAGYFSEFYKDARRQRDATLVPVEAPAETHSIDFYLKPFAHKRGTITGRVVSDDGDSPPLQGAVVIAFSPGNRIPHITFTGAHGFYKLTDLKPGKYFVFAWAQGFIGEFFKDAYLFRNARPVFVRAGQVTDGIDFGLAPQRHRGIYAVRGKVYSAATHTPIEGMLVNARTDGEIEVNAVTDADGNYEIAGLPAGQYKIEATGVGFANGYFGGTNSENAMAVTVGNGQDAENVDLNLEVDNVTDVETDDMPGAMPESFDLFQNYPNPFNPETTIKYQLSEAAPLTLKIFNVLGQEIRTLVDKQQPAGVYTVNWDGKDNFGRQVASGIYIFQINAGDKFKMSKRMLLLK